MKYYLLLLVFLLGCGTKNESIIGSYNSEGQTLFSNTASVFFKEYRIYRSVGLKLQINSDSTYIEKYCISKVEGKWKIKNDSLVLIPLRFYSTQDSIDKNNYKKVEGVFSRSELIKFKIKTGSLERIEINKKGKKVLTKYIKVE
jgi:hypothetical protein